MVHNLRLSPTRLPTHALLTPSPVPAHAARAPATSPTHCPHPILHPLSPVTPPCQMSLFPQRFAQLHLFLVFGPRKAAERCWAGPKPLPSLPLLAMLLLTHLWETGQEWGKCPLPRQPLQSLGRGFVGGLGVSNRTQVFKPKFLRVDFSVSKNVISFFLVTYVNKVVLFFKKRTLPKLRAG